MDTLMPNIRSHFPEPSCVTSDPQALLSLLCPFVSKVPVAWPTFPVWLAVPSGVENLGKLKLARLLSVTHRTEQKVETCGQHVFMLQGT